MTEPPAASPASAPEGVIGFAYALDTPDGDIAATETLHTLCGWRAVLRRLELLGQTPGRYQGFGYGNLSARDGARPDQFVITASQTSGAPGFGERQLVRIVRASVERFWVDAVGHQPPSSESLTHAMIYQADPAIAWVMHVHSPDIWSRASPLGLPATPEDAGYGTPAMARAVAELLRANPVRPLVFVTLGHEDGVFACGASAAAAGTALTETLAAALG